jgi:hypothetical protein
MFLTLYDIARELEIKLGLQTNELQTRQLDINRWIDEFLREDEAASQDLHNVQDDGVNHVTYDDQDLAKSDLQGSSDREVLEYSFDEDHVPEASAENCREASKSEQSSPQIKSPPSDEFNILDSNEISDSIPMAEQQDDTTRPTGKSIELSA